MTLIVFSISSTLNFSMKAFAGIVLALLLFCGGKVQAQEQTKAPQDSLFDLESIPDATPVFHKGLFRSDSLPRPARAALYSAMLPGLGQMYNGKYWKVPIIYGAAAIMAYSIKTNNYYYTDFRNALFAAKDNDSRTVNPYDGLLSTDQLNTRVANYRRQRDYMIIIAFMLYGLNIVDATVDAHLAGFRISNDLSLNLTPTFQRLAGQQSMTGLSLNLNLDYGTYRAHRLR